MTRDGACHVVTIVGPPIGSRRLVREFVSAVPGDALVAQGRCLLYGEGITTPVAEVVRELAQADDDPVSELSARLAGRLSGEADAELVQRRSPPPSVSATARRLEEAFWAFRRLLEALAREQPVVVVFDDVQWGEETFLDLIEHVVEHARDARVLLGLPGAAGAARRPAGLGRRKAQCDVRAPGAAARRGCGLLVQRILGEESSTRRPGRASSSVGRNPFFVEEMVGMLFEEGLLERENGHWSSSRAISGSSRPGSIQALLGGAPRSPARAGAPTARARRGRGRGVPPRRGRRPPGEPDLDAALQASSASSSWACAARSPAPTPTASATS